MKELHFAEHFRKLYHMKPFIAYSTILCSMLVGSPAFAGEMDHAERSTAPAGFEENKGQVLTTEGGPASFVRYRLTDGNTNIFLLGNGIAYQFGNLHHPAGQMTSKNDATYDAAAGERSHAPRERLDLETYRMDMVLEGSDPMARITAEGISADYTQYYGQNALDVHTYTRIIYHAVYPGIDWVVYTTQKGMKYDFVVHPGADPAMIQLRFKHHEELYVDANGALIHGNRMGRFTEERPVSFQRGKEVPTKFKLDGELLTFELAGYDRNETLTIDPDRIWGTYYGGTDMEEDASCTADGDGNVYLAGSTSSSYAIGSGGYQNSFAGYSDGFLVKFNANGVRQWGTYYGGIEEEKRLFCAVDALGNIYLSGTTRSDSAIAIGGHQDVYGGGYTDAFIVKFDQNGVRIWATYYGGAGIDASDNCVVDGENNVYLLGESNSATGIAFAGHSNIYDGRNAFLVKFDPNGVRIWGTYYGGSGESCTTDGQDNVYIAGTSQNADTSLVYQGHQMIHGADNDAFLVKFNSAGVRQWGTYYGGGASDIGTSCAGDSDGNVYLGGYTWSTTAIESGGHQSALSAWTDAFLVKFNSAGVRQWGTYYGGDGGDFAYSCATDSSGNVFISGTTQSTTAIASNGFQDTIGGYIDAYVVKFNSDGIRQWGTYYGGTNTDLGESCAVDPNGNVYLAGSTGSPTGIATPGAHDTGFSGSVTNTRDAYLVKFDDMSLPTGLGSPPTDGPSFAIWPNPNSGDRLYLRAETLGPATVEFFDALGKLQHRVDNVQLEGRTPVALSSAALPMGLYLVRITVEGRWHTAPLLVE
jgi:hypothetical protein